LAWEKTAEFGGQATSHTSIVTVFMKRNRLPRKVESRSAPRNCHQQQVEASNYSQESADLRIEINIPEDIMAHSRPCGWGLVMELRISVIGFQAANDDAEMIPDWNYLSTNGSRHRVEDLRSQRNMGPENMRATVGSWVR
jgi:hypothetical protein